MLMITILTLFQKNLEKTVAKTIKYRKTGELARIDDDEADKLVRKGKARYADRNEWRRWQRQRTGARSSSSA